MSDEHPKCSLSSKSNYTREREKEREEETTLPTQLLLNSRGAGSQAGAMRAQKPVWPRWRERGGRRRNVAATLNCTRGVGRKSFASLFFSSQEEDRQTRKVRKTLEQVKISLKLYTLNRRGRQARQAHICFTFHRTGLRSAEFAKAKHFSFAFIQIEKKRARKAKSRIAHCF